MSRSDRPLSSFQRSRNSLSSFTGRVLRFFGEDEPPLSSCCDCTGVLVAAIRSNDKLDDELVRRTLLWLTRNAVVLTKPNIIIVSAQIVAPLVVVIFAHSMQSFTIQWQLPPLRLSSNYQNTCNFGALFGVVVVGRGSAAARGGLPTGTHTHGDVVRTKINVGSYRLPPLLLLPTCAVRGVL